MKFHIEKPSIIDKSVVVYYAGKKRWTDDFSQRQIYEESPTSIIENPDGKNGGWSNATIVSEE
jgi:hypothetical protein